MKKHTKLCSSCRESKPLYEFKGKEYKDGPEETTVLYLSAKCNVCTGIVITSPLVRAKQLYYAQLETLICTTGLPRVNVCRKEHFSLKYGASKSKVRQGLIKQGLIPTDEAAEAAWYKMHTDRLRRTVRRTELRQTTPKRKAGRKPGRERGDYNLEDI